MIRSLTLFAAIAILAACNRPSSLPYTSASYSERVAGSADARTLPAGAGNVESYADVVDRVSPAVVTIRSARRVRAPQQFPFLNDPFFGMLFGNRQPNAPRGGSGVERALGSGVIVNADGSILTNHHVVDGAEQITVEMPNKQTYSAKLVGSDAPSDLAVLKIGASNLPILALGDSDRVRVGDICLALGNPLGIGETVTAGIISAKGRSTGLSDGSFEDFLQTDAAINQGNSGGALVNTRGELIGINSQIVSTSGGNIGLGFAVPSNMARTVLSQLVKGGKVRRGQLGVSIQPMTSDIAANLGLKDVNGVLVSSVAPGSAAERAGIKAGDVIVAMNGQPVNNSNELRNRVAATAPGTEVALTLWRNGGEQQVKATLGELTAESAQGQQGGGPSSGGGGKFGLSVRTLTPDDAGQLGLPANTRGALVQSVDPGGPAADGGIQAGDVIMQANGQAVQSGDELRQALGKSGSKPALVLVNRGGQTIYLTVRPAS